MVNLFSEPLKLSEEEATLIIDYLNNTLPDVYGQLDFDKYTLMSDARDALVGYNINKELPTGYNAIYLEVLIALNQMGDL